MTDPRLGYPILWWVAVVVVSGVVIAVWRYLEDRHQARIDADNDYWQDVELDLLFRQQRRNHPGRPTVPDFVPDEWTTGQ